MSATYANGRLALIGDPVISAKGASKDLFTIRCTDGAFQRLSYFASAGEVVDIDGLLAYVRRDECVVCADLGKPPCQYLAVIADLIVQGDS